MRAQASPELKAYASDRCGRVVRMLRLLAGMAIPVLAFLVLFSPAWINGSPIYWYDSLAHLHGGSSALNTALGLDTRFSVMEQAVAPEPGAPRSVDQAGRSDLSSSVVTGPPKEDYRISMARSPYYSVIVVFLSDMGGPFAPIIAQVLLLMQPGSSCSGRFSEAALPLRESIF